jgi:MerR family transcriptional regulator, light-induced transcriptional regulator
VTAVMHSKHLSLPMPNRRPRAGSPRGSYGVKGGSEELLAGSDARRYGVNRLNQSSANSDLQGSEDCLEFTDDQTGAFLPAVPLPSARERMARIVRTIEQDIIPRLVQAHRAVPETALVVTPAAPAMVAPVEQADVLSFVQAVLAQDDGLWQALTDRLLAQGLAVGDIYLHLLAPAAQELGRMWDEDLCSFTDVTVAVGRMQRVLRALSPAFGHEVDHPQNGRRVLLVPAPGEQHTFGLAIVAEFFRRAGWEVVGDSEARTADPAALVRSEWFDVIGISVGSDARLDWLKAGIGAIRNASRNRSIGVLVGGPSFAADMARVRDVGADGTASDGQQAPVMAEQLLAERLRARA